ncbi:hypothetical protein SSX86_025892 [Deinandra increscens subsp. villosa]|uniref:Uncharacterized protein n=1 Tax=Deinandra increscens subsp. villosa TaxID=3103831 RepID=A0AAP0CH60_9ASTR
MPTFTTIALQNLLEHRIPSKDSSTLHNSESSSTNKPPDHEEDEKSKARKRLNHIYISPALYTTPEPTPILDYSASGSVSPSPYVFNRKGRGGGNSANRRIDGFEVQSCVEVGSGEGDLVESGLFGGGGNDNCVVVEGEDGDDDDDNFVDPRCDSVSVASSSDLNDSGRLGLENMSVVSNQIGEFYDATEDFSSEGSIVSCRGNIESELHTARVNLLEEIEKRKAAEDELAAMYTHWQRVSNILLPQTDVTPISNDISPTLDAVWQLSEEIIVARFVAEAMGKAEARAEAELAAQVIIQSRDKEISRLQDRLQYYEAMIHEMSQNNLESMEVARRHRERKRGQRKWLWRCIGVSIVIGASVIAYSYAPPHDHHQSLETVNDTQPEAV